MSIRSAIGTSEFPIPIGVVLPYPAVGGAPETFLVCDGASLSIGDYPELYEVIGTTYGSVDLFHFNLPNLVGKFIKGSAINANQATTPAGTAAISVTLTESNMPSFPVTYTGNLTGGFSNDPITSPLGNNPNDSIASTGDVFHDDGSNTNTSVVVTGAGTISLAKTAAPTPIAVSGGGIEPAHYTFIYMIKAKYL